MKIRKGFVSNSSSSSFICDVSGEEHQGMDIGLEGAGPELVAGMFLGMFEKHRDAQNYIELTFESSSGPVLVTLMRPGGKTPHQLRREAEEKLAAFIVAHPPVRAAAAP